MATALRPSSGRPSPHVGLGGPRAPAWALTIGAFGGLAYAVLVAIALLSANADLLQALSIAPLLVMLTVPIALGIARREGDRTLAAIVMAALIAKLASALVRYYVAFIVYDGASDASQYNTAARTLAPKFREFDFDTGIGKVIGTGFLKIVTGVVYAIFGTSKIGGFLVFAWLGFIGLLLFWRAFRIAVPEGDGRRYLLLVLFLPSLLYWPSAIGKEAWTLLALGACAYGVARILRQRGPGMVVLSVGLLGVAMVRPHIGLVLFVGVVFAMLVQKTRARSYLVPLARVTGLAIILGIGVLLAGRTASFLGTESLTQESVEVELSETETQTADGGSQFTPVRVSTPLHYPVAFVTVFFRPFVTEAGNAQGVLSALEGVVLGCLCLASWKRIRAIPQLLRSSPYIAFSIGYVLAFVYAFSSFSNFGILARQRVQALPLLLVLLAIPEYRAEVPSPSPHSSRQRGVPRRLRSAGAAGLVPQRHHDEPVRTGAGQLDRAGTAGDGQADLGLGLGTEPEGGDRKRTRSEPRRSADRRRSEPR